MASGGRLESNVVCTRKHVGQLNRIETCFKLQDGGPSQGSMLEKD